MSQLWTPKKVNHTELRATSVGVQTTFMFLLLFMPLLVIIAAFKYAFTGIQLDGGDTTQTVQAIGDGLNRLGKLDEFFEPGMLIPLLLESLVPAVLTGIALYVIIAYLMARRKM